MHKGPKGETEIQGNWTKFVVNQKGHVVNRFSPPMIPENFDIKITEILG